MNKLLRGILIGLGGLVVVILIAGGVFYYLLTRPSPVGPQALAPGATPTLTPPPQVVEQRAQALETKLATLEKQITQAEQSRSPQTIRLEITEDEVNAMILRDLPRMREEMKESAFIINSAQVTFRDGKLKATAQAEINAFKPNIYLEARVEPENGKPKVVVEKIDLGRLPLPGAVKEQINTLIQDMFRQATESSSQMDVKAITIAEGKLVLEGVVLPSAPGQSAPPPPLAPASQANLEAPAPPAQSIAVPASSAPAAPGVAATPTRAPTPLATTPPTPVQTPPPIPTSGPASLDLDPDDVALFLTMGLQEMQKKQALPLQIGAVKVDLSKAKVVAQAPISYSGFSFDVPIEATVTASGGKALLAMQVTESNLPPTMARQIDSFLGQGMTVDVGFQISSVALQGGKLVVKGTGQQ